MPTSPRPSDGTSDRILDVAERLVQTRGFNAFSYADVAAELGITKASLHYHFATKMTLGAHLIERYAERFEGALLAIDRSEKTARRRLAAYAELYGKVLRSNRMCLCGMLAADYATLPGEMSDRLKTFFDVNERWLAGVLDSGKKAKELRFTGPAYEQARVLVSAFEGAMLVARSYSDPTRFTAAALRLLAGLDARATPLRRAASVRR